MRHVPVPMSSALTRQRSAFTMCKGPDDWPLLTLFGDVPRGLDGAVGSSLLTKGTASTWSAS